MSDFAPVIPEALRPKPKSGMPLFKCPYCSNRHKFDFDRPADIKPSITAVSRLPHPHSRRIAFAVITFYHQMTFDQLAATSPEFWIEHGMTVGHALDLHDIVQSKKRLQDGNPKFTDWFFR
jgi:hypothetical protein